MMGKNVERIVFVDFVRVAACLMVMLVHASENFYGADSSGLAGNMSMLLDEQNRFWVAFFDGGLSRTAVPLFFIISSYLLLPLREDMTMMQFYRKRLKRVVPPMLFFMLLYSLLPLLWNGMTWEQSLRDLRMLLWNFPSMGGHLWFMYPLLGLYLFMPVISPWIRGASARDLRFFLLLFFISSFTSWIHLFWMDEIWGECFWNRYSLLWYFSGFIGYMVLGQYVRRCISWNERQRILVGLSCFLIGAAFTAWSFYFMGVPKRLIETPRLEWGWEFCTPMIILATFGLFLLFSAISLKKTPRLVAELSRLSYGMFLTHLFFLGLMVKILIPYGAASPLVPVYLAIPLIALGTFVLSALAIKILSVIPFLRPFSGC